MAAISSSGDSTLMVAVSVPAAIMVLALVVAAMMRVSRQDLIAAQP